MKRKNGKIKNRLTAVNITAAKAAQSSTVPLRFSSNESHGQRFVNFIQLLAALSLTQTNVRRYFLPFPSADFRPHLHLLRLPHSHRSAALCKVGKQITLAVHSLYHMVYYIRSFCKVYHIIEKKSRVEFYVCSRGRTANFAAHQE